MRRSILLTGCLMAALAASETPGEAWSLTRGKQRAVAIEVSLPTLGDNWQTARVTGGLWLSNFHGLASVREHYRLEDRATVTPGGAGFQLEGGLHNRHWEAGVVTSFLSASTGDVYGVDVSGVLATHLDLSIGHLRLGAAVGGGNRQVAGAPVFGSLSVDSSWGTVIGPNHTLRGDSHLSVHFNNKWGWEGATGADLMAASGFGTRLEVKLSGSEAPGDSICYGLSIGLILPTRLGLMANARVWPGGWVEGSIAVKWLGHSGNPGRTIAP